LKSPSIRLDIISLAALGQPVPLPVGGCTHWAASTTCNWRPQVVMWLQSTSGWAATGSWVGPNS